MEEGGGLCKGFEYGTEQAAEEEEEVRTARLLAKLERQSRVRKGAPRYLTASTASLPGWLLPAHPEAPAPWLLKVVALTVGEVPAWFPQQLRAQVLSSRVTGWPGAWGLRVGRVIGPW